MTRQDGARQQQDASLPQAAATGTAEKAAAEVSAAAAVGSTSGPLLASGGAAVSVAQQITRVAREAGVGPFRQFREILALRGGERGLRAPDYYAFGLYRPDLSPEDKRAFVSDAASSRLNLRLSPPMLTHLRGFLSDKFAYPLYLEALGMPTTRLAAAYLPGRDAGNRPSLADADAIARYLGHEARLPLFGKPLYSLRALGSVLIAARSADGATLTLGDGRQVGTQEVAAQIAKDHPSGYLFQQVVAQDPQVTARVGPAVATLRMVTVIAEDRPELLYALWKMPAPQAHSDNFWQAGSLIAPVDVGTGTVGSARRGTGPDSAWLDLHPATGAELRGYALPQWQAARDLALRAHAQFPVNGILGFDIALGADGPLVVECNENPSHTLYQFATGRGFLNAEFRAVIARIEARNARLQSAREARHAYFAQGG